MNRARYAPRVLEGRALLAVVCHGALVLARAVRSKSPRGSRRVRSMGRITIRKHWKCSQAICTVASATCNSHVLLRRQRLIVEVVDGVAAETVSRQCRHRTWQGAVNVEQRVSVQMRSDAVVQASLGCEVEDAFERDDREHRAAGREGGQAGDVEDKRKAGREGGRAGDAAVKRAARASSGLTRSAAARRLHGHDDDAFISPTTSIPGRASVRDRINRAKDMTVRQAILTEILHDAIA